MYFLALVILFVGWVFGVKVGRVEFLKPSGSSKSKPSAEPWPLAFTRGSCICPTSAYGNFLQPTASGWSLKSDMHQRCESYLAAMSGRFFGTIWQLKVSQCITIFIHMINMASMYMWTVDLEYPKIWRLQSPFWINCGMILPTRWNYTLNELDFIPSSHGSSVPPVVCPRISCCSIQRGWCHRSRRPPSPSHLVAESLEWFQDKMNKLRKMKLYKKKTLSLCKSYIWYPYNRSWWFMIWIIHLKSFEYNIYLILIELLW